MLGSTFLSLPRACFITSFASHIQSGPDFHFEPLKYSPHHYNLIDFLTRYVVCKFQVLLPARRQNTQAIKPLPLGAVFEYDTEIGGLFVQSVEKYPARGALPTDGRVKPGAVLSALDGNNLLDVPIEQIVQVRRCRDTRAAIGRASSVHIYMRWQFSFRALTFHD